MLNLRGIYLAASDSPSGSYGDTAPISASSATLSHLRFSSAVAVGNLGAPLSHGMGSFATDLIALEKLGADHDAAAEEHEADEWSVEDEVLESSRDPLAAGLGRAGDT